MEVHRPKPIHGWRDFIKEVGVIVLGVAIALTGEQIVEAFHWAHKVADAEAAIRQELAEDLSYAQELRDLNPCASRYMDILQSAIARDRPDIIQKLYALGTPIDGHPWRADSWVTAQGGQVPDHLSAERVSAYSKAFRFVVAERDSQWDAVDLYGQVMAGRFGLLKDPGVANDQLKAVDRLRAKEAQRMAITSALLDMAPKALGIAASPARVEEFRRTAQACEAGLQTVAPA